MHKHLQKFVIGLGAGLTVFALFSASVFANQSGTECIPTDVKGSISYTGDHISGNPVIGSLVNIATNPDCSDEVYIHVFGSNIEPNGPDWLESQTHITTQVFTVPQDGIDMPFELTLPQSDFCWYQVDVTRTPEVLNPPYYYGDNMIEYVFVQNKEVCGEVTPTPTATPSATPTDTPTPTPGNNEGNGGGSGSGGNEEPTKTVESIQATLATTTMAPTGNALQGIMHLLATTGMMVSALGAVSYAKERKTH